MDAAGVSNTTASPTSPSAGGPTTTVTATPPSSGSGYTGGDMAAVGLTFAVILLGVITALTFLLVKEKKKHNKDADRASLNSITASSCYPKPYEYTS